MDVYVRGYGGWMLSVTSRLHAHLLTKELERVRASYNYNYHYGVGYDRYHTLYLTDLISDYVRKLEITFERIKAFSKIILSRLLVVEKS